MPEAVASNSIPVSECQPTVDAFELLTALEDNTATLYSLGEMVTRQLEAEDERMGSGFNYMFRRAVEELDDIRHDLGKAYRSQAETDRIVADANGLLRSVEPRELEGVAHWFRSYMVAQGLARGLGVSELAPAFGFDEVTLEILVARLKTAQKWHDPEREIEREGQTLRDGMIVAMAATGATVELMSIAFNTPVDHVRLIIETAARQNGSPHPEAEADRAAQRQAIAKRRELIFQQSQAGASVREISQMFQIRQSAVERIIARLTDSEKGDRKAS